MSISTSTKNSGVTLIESVIAILIVSIGLLGLLSMQPSAWQTSTRADYLGHAAMILSQELMRNELLIMNPCNTVAAGTISQNYDASGQPTGGAGVYAVQTTIADAAMGAIPAWRVTVRVTWPLNPSTGIADSVVAIRQEPFRFGCS